MRQISTVIEIGTSKVVSIISEVGQYDESHILGSASVQYAGYKNRHWVDRHAVAPAIVNALHEAEHIAGKRCKHVHVGIPADFVRVVCRRAEITFAEHKTITRDDVDRLYQTGRSKLNVPKEYMLIHRCPVVFILDGVRRTMEPVGRRATKFGAIISYVLAEKWFTGGISNILENYNYSPSTFISASYAEAMRFIPQEKRDHGAVMIDFGATSTCVMVARGDGLIYHKVLPFGGDNITSDLQKVFSVEKNIAEELKKRSIFGLSLGKDDYYEICDRESYKFVQFSAMQVQMVIETRMNEMLNLIIDALDRSGCNLPQYVPVFVTGGTASMRGLREYIQKITNHNTQIILPQSTCFNQPCFSSSLAVTDMALEAEADDEPGFFESIKNLFGK